MVAFDLAGAGQDSGAARSRDAIGVDDPRKGGDKFLAMSRVIGGEKYYSTVGPADARLRHRLLGRFADRLCSRRVTRLSDSGAYHNAGTIENLSARGQVDLSVELLAPGYSVMMAQGNLMRKVKPLPTWLADADAPRRLRQRVLDNPLHHVFPLRSCPSFLPQTSQGTHTVKTVPLPSSLSTLIFPCNNAVQRLTICRPKPMPSCTRVFELSTWLNFSKITD